MPKLAVALISGALAGVFGFLLGSLFTLPQNKEMEELVQTKNEMTLQIKMLSNEKESLIKSNETLKKDILGLKDKLLKAYDVETEPSLF